MIKLLLFDIDGTLVLTGGAGGRAMARAAQELFDIPDAMATIPMAGRTDAWIVAQMAQRGGVRCDGPALEMFRERYLSYLATEIHEPGNNKGVLPGIRPVLETLNARADAHVGLLTGNFEAGARLKLDYFDLWKFFSGGAFGDSLHNRNDLLDVALQGVRAAGGPAVDRSDVWIIGDTPLDIAVATAGGARSLGVATGGYSVKELEASGADCVMKDLSDINAALAAMGFSEKQFGPG